MTKGNKPFDSHDSNLDTLGPTSRRQPAGAGVINPIPTGYWSGDTSGELPDVLIPWEQAAGYLAAELVPDNESKRFEAVEAYSRTHPGQLPPLLDGKVSDRAYLAVMRTGESKRIEHAIQTLMASGVLELFTPGASLPTREKSGALISTAQVLRLMRDSRHLADPTSESAAADGGQAREKKPEDRQARRYQMCVDAGLKMPVDDYAPLPRGIGKLADQEGIARQSFSEDVKAHIRRLHKPD